MASVNKVILLGNLGRDPETRYTTGGDAVTNLNIATSEQWKDKSGEKQERTEWHRVVLFGRQAEIAGEYLKKGRSVYIEGRLQTRKYTDKDGVEKYSTEIVADRMQLLGGRDGPGGGGGDVDFSAANSSGGERSGGGGGGGGARREGSAAAPRAPARAPRRTPTTSTTTSRSSGRPASAGAARVRSSGARCGTSALPPTDRRRARGPRRERAPLRTHRRSSWLDARRRRLASARR